LDWRLLAWRCLQFATANAGDFDGPAYGPYPRYNAVPPVYRRAEVGDAFCRILHERRIDPYGRETIHRIRICNEGPIGWTVAPQEYGYGPLSFGLTLKRSLARNTARVQREPRWFITSNDP
jgi:hypothetical protein